MRTVRIIGPGRAGRSLAGALEETGKWRAVDLLGRGDPIRHAAHGVDLLVIATPDTTISAIAASIEPADGVVAHLAGSLGLDVLHPCPKDQRAAIHPLVSLADAGVGAQRLRAGAWFAVAGNELATEVVEDLGGSWFRIPDERRGAYHAAACIASNHLVALLGQAERVGRAAGVPFEAYLDLVRSTVENVAELGPAAALTGPAARGDWETIEGHRAVLDPDELESYDAMVTLARRLVADQGEH